MRKDIPGEMTAAVVARYGGPASLRVTTVPVPTIGRRDLLIRVHATAVSAGDVRIRSAHFPRGFGLLGRLAFGVTGPRAGILGGTYSGTVVAVGAQVADVAVGDEVCGMTGARLGTWAEYVAVRGTASLAHKPDGVTHQQAAGLLFGGTAALCYVRDKLEVAAGESVAINGATGAVGRYAVQLARHLGAEVSVVARSADEPWLRRLGAHHVIDRAASSLAACGRRFDVVLDTSGTIRPRDARTLLAPGGRLGLVAGDLSDMLRARGGVKVGVAAERAADIAHLLDLVASRNLEVVVDRTCTLADIVAAHELADVGTRVGTIVLDTTAHRTREAAGR
jgi:NADPH:quinone reductase-like Zn-dependent oxidoreductase